MRVVTVTVNPAFDKTLRLPALKAGDVHRATLERAEIGGKGINVALALRVLGVELVIAAGLIGSESASLFDGVLTERGIMTAFLPLPGAVRVNLTLITEDGVVTKINEAGPAATLDALDGLLAYAAAAQPGDLWALCGSLPPAAPPDLYAQIIRRVQHRGALTFLDSSGEALRLGAAAHPYALKINAQEAGELLGSTPGMADAARAAHSLQAHYAAVIAAITFGSAGLVVAAGDETATRPAAPVAAVNTVGAGDAVLAGLLDGVQRRLPLRSLAAWMLACGGSAAAQCGSGMGSKAEVERLYGLLID